MGASVAGSGGGVRYLSVVLGGFGVRLGWGWGEPLGHRCGGESKLSR